MTKEEDKLKHASGDGPLCPLINPQLERLAVHKNNLGNNWLLIMSSRGPQINPMLDSMNIYSKEQKNRAWNC